MNKNIGNKTILTDKGIYLVKAVDQTTIKLFKG